MLINNKYLWLCKIGKENVLRVEGYYNFQLSFLTCNDLCSYYLTKKIGSSYFFIFTLTKPFLSAPKINVKLAKKHFHPQKIHV